MAMKYNFNDVTLLITHYNRSHSLQRLLESFEKLNCTFNEIIVSDDASEKVHLDLIMGLQTKYVFTLITADKNKGLANNLNKGQKSVKTPFTLYIQEDFVPKEIFPEKLQDSLGILKVREDLDMARYYSYFKYPNLKYLKHGFSEMIFSPLKVGYQKFYYYSDHPHLRKSNFLEKFGEYEEGIKSDAAEYKMMMTFLRKSGKAIYYDKFKDLFDQINSTLEPSTVKRNSLRESNNVFIRVIRGLYKNVKFNIDLYK